MDHDIDAGADALEDLLDAERAALLAGKLDEVSRLHGRKERLIDGLQEHATMGGSKFEGLNEKVKRNQILLDSALSGIRSVSRRLNAIRQVSKSLETYDSQGRKLTVDIRKGGTLEKRS